MELINTLTNNSLVFSILVVGVLNTLIFLVVLLVRQRNRISQDLSRIEKQMARLTETSFEMRQQFSDLEKRLLLRTEPLKIEETHRPGAEVVKPKPIKAEQVKTEVPVLEVEPISKPTIDRFRSQAEDDILAALAAV